MIQEGRPAVGVEDAALLARPAVLFACRPHSGRGRWAGKSLFVSDVPVNTTLSTPGRSRFWSETDGKHHPRVLQVMKQWCFPFCWSGFFIPQAAVVTLFFLLWKRAFDQACGT